MRYQSGVLSLCIALSACYRNSLPPPNGIRTYLRQQTQVIQVFVRTATKRWRAFAEQPRFWERGNRDCISPTPLEQEGTQPKRGRKPLFDPAIFAGRFRTIERVFAWEDKFRRSLLRFDRLS
jgi:hypothetical protein